MPTIQLPQILQDLSHSTSMNRSKVVFSQIIFFQRSKISKLGFQATVRVMTWWIFMHSSRNCSNLPLAKQWRCNEPWMSWSVIPLDVRIWVDPMMLGIGRCCKTRIVDESFHWRLISVDQAPGPKFPDTKSRNHKCRRKGRGTSFHTKSEPAIHTVAVSCDAMICGVMSCHVMSCQDSRHLMWCDFLCFVMSFDVMWCSYVMSCHLVWSDGMHWDGMLCACDAMWLVVRSCYVIRNGCVMWSIGRWCAVNYAKLMLQYCDSVLQSTTRCDKYYKVSSSREK